MLLNPVVFYPAILGIVFSSCVMASDMAFLAQTTPAERAGVQTHFMTQKLNLDTPTQIKIAAINQKYADLVEPILHNDDSSFSKMLSIRSLQDRKDTELKSILTPAQYDTYENSRDELKAEMEQKLSK